MTDRNIKLTAKMPDGSANGLADPDVIRRIFNDPTRWRVGIIVFNAPKFDGDTEAETETRKATIKRIEVIMDDDRGDATALERLLHRAYERRTGATTLDADLEDDVRAAFDHLHLDDEPATGIVATAGQNGDRPDNNDDDGRGGDR
jgi:hypothetical protein